MGKEEFIMLNREQIEKFNDYSCNLGTLKRVFDTTIEYIENETTETINSICLLYVVHSYVENLKKNFTEFLKECDILL